MSLPIVIQFVGKPLIFMEEENGGEQGKDQLAEAKVIVDFRSEIDF